MRIGIFGGTFNPPHMGHVAAATACVQRLGLDALWLVPAGTPPHKDLPVPPAGAAFSLPTAAQRLEMAALAARLIPGGAACGIELERSGPSYTIDTLGQIAARHPDDTLWLVVGTDMLLSFEQWRAYREIAALARLAVVSREDGDLDALRLKAAWLARDCGARVDIIGNPPVAMSSTQARAGAIPQATEAGPALPPDVAVYIARHRLYGEATILDALRQTARQRLSARRYRHTLGTETAAARLAAAHGEDVFTARMAALLHDITKDIPLPGQIELCRQLGIRLEYPPEQFPSIVHADTGAAVARQEFAMEAPLCDAIRYHTTGRPGMTRLDKILYVADKIEETRTFGDVPPIRQVAERSLEAATAMVLRGCLQALARQGQQADGRTLETLRFMEGTHCGQS